ncbi:hypothetical protein SAMN05421833_129110 [Microbispora rosea]|uniref:Uncharacterized protein n=1 Tax=Microbispora rosea TaxID=58117 RepID=A0A1N7GJS9_9ACTN|nr:hypothetical protein [Microbispora rosea]GIH52938.1 hypothetical protein Mro03_81170 [Microbispora rosea subsp. rosea]SIS12748.1 hypothetical protein SAMN05421833_129110 [Microbispora rosea]
MTISVIVVLVGLLAVGLVGFFADPLHLPPQLLQVLDQRASVVSMFIGAAGLVVAVVALLLQVRADARQATSPSAAAAPAEASVLQTPPAESPLQRTESGGERRTYGGDHIEFHHSTFGGTVVGKQVTGPTPSAPPPTPSSVDGDGDDRG